MFNGQAAIKLKIRDKLVVFTDFKFWTRVISLNIGESVFEFKKDAISDIVQLAWCDKTSFKDIKVQYGLTENEIKILMRKTLKPKSYQNWRKRVRRFRDSREVYK